MTISAHSLGQSPIAFALDGIPGLHAIVADLVPLLGVVPVQLVDPTRVGEADEQSDEEELEDVDDHPTEGDLEGTQVRVDREQVYQLQGTEYVGGGKQALGYQGGIVGVPLLPRHVGGCLAQPFLLFNLEKNRGSWYSN